MTEKKTPHVWEPTSMSMTAHDIADLSSFEVRMLGACAFGMISKELMLGAARGFNEDHPEGVPMVIMECGPISAVLSPLAAWQFATMLPETCKSVEDWRDIVTECVKLNGDTHPQDTDTGKAFLSTISGVPECLLH